MANDHKALTDLGITELPRITALPTNADLAIYNRDTKKFYRIDSGDLFAGGGGLTVDTVLVARSVAVSQNPVAVDAPIQIEYGPAQFTAADPVMISALGTVTFNQPGLYQVTSSGHFGRTGAPGQAELRFRSLVNGIQVAPTLAAKLDDSNVILPVYSNTFIKIQTGGDTLLTQMYRDSTGINDGGLFAAPVSLAGWDVSHCASIIIRRMSVSV